MADHDNPNETGPGRSESGNRWEPDPDHSSEASTPGDQTPEGVTPEAQSAENTARSGRLSVSRGRRAIAGAAAGALLIGGLGGFGVGYAAADRGNDVELSGSTSDDDGGSLRGPGGRRGLGGPGGGLDEEDRFIVPDQDSGGLGPLQGEPVAPGADEVEDSGASA